MSRSQGSMIGLVALLVCTGSAFADGVRSDHRSLAHSNVVVTNQVRTFTAPNRHSSAFSRNVPQGNAYAYGHQFNRYSPPGTPMVGRDHDGPKTTTTVPEGSSLLMFGFTLVVVAGAIRRKVLA